MVVSVVVSVVDPLVVAVVLEVLVVGQVGSSSPSAEIKPLEEIVDFTLED